VISCDPPPSTSLFLSFSSLGPLLVTDSFYRGNTPTICLALTHPEPQTGFRHPPPGLYSHSHSSSFVDVHAIYPSLGLCTLNLRFCVPTWPHTMHFATHKPWPRLRVDHFQTRLCVNHFWTRLRVIHNWIRLRVIHNFRLNVYSESTLTLMSPSYTLSTIDWSFGIPLTTIIRTGLHYSFVPSAPYKPSYLLRWPHAAVFVFMFGLHTPLLLSIRVYTPLFSWDYAPAIFLGLCTHYFSLGLCTHYLFWVYTPAITWVYAPPLSFFGFTHPLSIIWAYAPFIFAGFTHPLYLFGFTHPLSFFWAYAPIILIWVYTPVTFRLGLRTRYLSLGFTHPLSIIWVYAPVIFAGFMHPLSSVWAYAPIILFGLRTRYISLGFTHPLCVTWVYAPIVYYLGLCTRYLSFGLTHPLSSLGYAPVMCRLGLRTHCLLSGFMHPLFLLGLRTHYTYLGFTHPLSFAWDYAPYIFYLAYAPSISLSVTQFLAWVFYHPPL
jgi:hypothetical protein